MYTPYISVLIDAYNYGHFIEEAIESVLEQDFPADSMEILVVDDGSTDDTRERVAKYSGRVKYLYKSNGGQASAFTFGIEKARGEIIALLDADDYWLPGKLSRVAAEFRAHPEVGLVYHPFREYQMETGEWKDGDFNAISGDIAGDKKQMLLYTAAQTSGLTFRTELVRKFLPLAPAMTIQADGLLAALIIFLAPVVAIPEHLAVYRIHGDNLYYHSAKGIDRERQLRRLTTLKVLLDEMDKWFSAHQAEFSRSGSRAFRTRWQHVYETEEFALAAPGRLRFFRHLVGAMKNMNPCLTKRIQMVNGLNAVGSLVTGYKHYARLDEWRIRLKRSWQGQKQLPAREMQYRAPASFHLQGAMQKYEMTPVAKKLSASAK